MQFLPPKAVCTIARSQEHHDLLICNKMASNSKEELKILEKFRPLVHDIDFDDEELLCFLRARNYDMKIAEKMLRQSWAWRKEHQFATAWNFETLDELNETFPIYVDGVDKNGQMVLFIPIGSWEVRKMLNAGWEAEMERHMYIGLSKIWKTRQESGHKKFVGIIDLAHLTYWKIADYNTIQMVLKMIRDFELNFPDKLSHAIVFNAPWILNYILPAIRPFVSATTWDKIQIIDANPSKYIPAILDWVPKNSMPSGLMDAIEKDLIKLNL